MAKLNNTLTQEELKRLLSYDQDTGVFIRLLKTSNSITVGEVAGFNRKGATHISLHNNEYLAHRLAWLYVYGEWPPEQIDHKNCNSRDNRIANLRLATCAQNNQNKHRPNKNNSCGLMGIYFDKEKRKWAAEITANRKRVRLGRFATAELASLAYQTAKKGLHPFSIQEV